MRRVTPSVRGAGHSVKRDTSLPRRAGLYFGPLCLQHWHGWAHCFIVSKRNGQASDVHSPDPARPTSRSQFRDQPIGSWGITPNNCREITRPCLFNTLPAANQLHHPSAECKYEYTDVGAKASFPPPRCSPLLLSWKGATPRLFLALAPSAWERLSWHSAAFPTTPSVCANR